MAADPDGRGYWLAASDGGVFSFDTVYQGGNFLPPALDDVVVGIASRPPLPFVDSFVPAGYWIAWRSGRVHNYGAAPNLDDAVSNGRDVVGIAARSSSGGYWLVVRPPVP
jgi:hypothetical protein